MSVTKKTIGVIGGMGPAATVDFFRRIVDSTVARRDQDHLHVLIDNQPSVPDRTAFLLGRGEDPVPVLIDAAQRLERAGADLLVMACNTAHAFAPQLAGAVSVPFVNWVDEAAQGVRRELPRARRVGLLATDGTIASGVYRRAFSEFGVDVLLPPAERQEQLMGAIYGAHGVKAGAADLSSARELVDAAGRALVDDGAEAVLLACTELSVLYDRYDPNWGAPRFDAAQLVAERVIELAGGMVKNRATGGMRSVPEVSSAR